MNYIKTRSRRTKSTQDIPLYRAVQQHATPLIILYCGHLFIRIEFCFFVTCIILNQILLCYNIYYLFGQENITCISKETSSILFTAVIFECKTKPKQTSKMARESHYYLHNDKPMLNLTWFDNNNYC